MLRIKKASSGNLAICALPGEKASSWYTVITAQADCNGSVSFEVLVGDPGCTYPPRYCLHLPEDSQSFKSR